RMRDARRVLAGAVAVDGTLAGGEESFPGDAGRIVDPGLLALRVAAGHLSLLDDGAAGLVQAAVHFAKFVFALDLDAEMIETRLLAARRDGEVDTRIVEHPLGVVRLHDRGRGRKQRRIKADRLRQALDAEMDMKAFHETVCLGLRGGGFAGAHASGAQDWVPWQQFSVR